MKANLVYLKLELKRALKKLPYLLAGAIVLVVFFGTIAFLSSRMLYGDEVIGRVTIGVVLPEEDLVAEKVVAMISSLESVKSNCDFVYLDQEESLDRLKKGTIFAVMEIPAGFVQAIMDGTNTPVNIILPSNAGLESRIFRELTDAGAKTLAASQAGIYAGDALCIQYQLEGSISQLEAELNRIFLNYSMPRADYFRHRKVTATQDIGLLEFYGGSACILILLLSGIPASTYLTPYQTVMKQKLKLLGVGAIMRIGARILGLTSLLAIVAIPIFIWGCISGWMAGGLLAGIMLILICLTIASFIVCIYQMAGTLMGGVMLLFLLGTAQHFLAGGFLPLIFLPRSLHSIAPFMPSWSMLEGIKCMVTNQWNPVVFLYLAVIIAVFTGISVGLEGKR